jgi:hypothetical protein
MQWYVVRGASMYDVNTINELDGDFVWPEEFTNDHHRIGGIRY